MWGADSVQAPQSALTPGPSPISHPRPRRERGERQEKTVSSQLLLVSPLPGPVGGSWERGRG